MRTSTLLLLLPAATQASPQLFGGLFGGFGGGGGGSGWPKVSSKFITPVYKSDAKREVVRYGPLVLAGKDASKPMGASIMAMDPKGQAGIVTISDGNCKKCTILSASFSITDQNNVEVKPAKDGVYIHHFVSYDTRKRASDPVMGCDGGFPMMGAPFIDRGEDSAATDTIFTHPNGQSEAGYHMDSGSLVVQYDMVNYNPGTKNVYINLEYEYKEGQSGKDAGHTLKSVTCNGAIPPKVSESGPAISTSFPMLVSSDARVVWARGHLHSGGVKMVMNLNGSPVCTSLPTYNDRGVITNMTLCPNFDLKRGQVMTISSEYDLTKHKLRESTSGHGGAQGRLFGSDVMGMFALSYIF